MVEDTYKTIAEPAEGLYKDKGSKFHAFAYPITGVEEVKPIIDELKTRFYDARHHCFAYRLGQGGDVFRAVDDGEPSGTAGRPILGQLQSADLTDILVIVVRYFGGTKLGVSGLISAYKEATIDVIENSEIIEKNVEATLIFEFSYLIMNDVMKLLKEFEPRIVEQTFDNLCKMKLTIRLSLFEALTQKAAKIEGLSVEIQK